MLSESHDCFRYFILSGSVLVYYKSERDIAQEPRGVLDVEGCTVVVDPEGTCGRDGPLVMSIEDPDGLHVIK